MARTVALPSRSVTHDVYEQLRADILACRLAPGVRLRISALCETLGGVSLGAVRESLSRLAADGLVVAEPQRGFRVSPVSVHDLEDLTAARAEIEALCLRKSIARGDAAWEAGIVMAFRTMARTPFRARGGRARLSDGWVAAHAKFHHALVAAAGNTWLLRLREQLYEQSERYRRLSVPATRTSRDLAAEHGGIMEAALARDAERAVSMLVDHLRLTTRVLLQADVPLSADPD